MLNLCHKCHILISYHFVPEVTFKNNQTVVVSPLTKLTVLVATLHKFSSLFSSLNTMLFTTRRRRTKAFVLFRFLQKKKKNTFQQRFFIHLCFHPPPFLYLFCSCEYNIGFLQIYMLLVFKSNLIQCQKDLCNKKHVIE